MGGARHRDGDVRSTQNLADLADQDAARVVLGAQAAAAALNQIAGLSPDAGDTLVYSGSAWTAAAPGGGIVVVEGTTGADADSVLIELSEGPGVYKIILTGQNGVVGGGGFSAILLRANNDALDANFADQRLWSVDDNFSVDGQDTNGRIGVFYNGGAFRTEIEFDTRSGPTGGLVIFEITTWSQNTGDVGASATSRIMGRWVEGDDPLTQILLEGSADCFLAGMNVRVEKRP